MGTQGFFNLRPRFPPSLQIDPNSFQEGTSAPNLPRPGSPMPIWSHKAFMWSRMAGPALGFVGPEMDQRAFGIQGPFGAPPFGTQRLFGNNVIWDPGVIRGPAIWDPGPLGIRTIGELGTFATQGPLGPSHWGSGPTPRDLEQGLGIWGKP